MNREEAEALIAETRQLTSGERFRNFVAQSHSRDVLRYLRADPSDWPRFTSSLDDDLLYIAHLLFWNGLQLKALTEFEPDGDFFIERAAEILEFLYAYAEADGNPIERVEQLFNASLGYYIAGHYARAYVLMKDLEVGVRLEQERDWLRRLFLKDLSGFRTQLQAILQDGEYFDTTIANLLKADTINEDEAIHRSLRISLARAFSFFLEFPKNGNRTHFARALEILDEGLALSQSSHFVDWWWLFYCAKYMFNEYDSNSFWTQLGPWRGDGNQNDLVASYIRSNYRRTTPIIELWRSQVAALPEVNDEKRQSYCLKMPTSAGKTKIAELAVLRFLLDYKDDPEAKCIYIAPFRSLAAELEVTLRRIFHPLGIRVSELYGGFELSPVERILMERTRVLIATPEKIDAFWRYNPEFSKQVKLVIIDEGHIINATERGLRFEFFLHRLVKRLRPLKTRFFFMSAVLPNIDQFAQWITGDSENIIVSEWRPSRLMIGEMRWGGRVGGIHYLYSGHVPLEHECYVTNFVVRREADELTGTRRRTPYPRDTQEAIADASLQFAQQDMTLVFVAQKRSVEPFGRTLLGALKIRDAIAKAQSETGFNLPIPEEHRKLLEDCISLARETMGDNADIVRFLEAGFVVHHAGLPQRLRIKLEELVRQQAVKLVIATTTLAQGVNFPIRTILVHSLSHGRDQFINPLDFWNICGRAGRGMNENEGQVLFAVDLTKDARTRQQERTRRQEIIERYQQNQVISMVRRLLGGIAAQWRITHPNVNVAEVCQLLAENDVLWAREDVRDELSLWLDRLDSQLIALAEEQLDTEFTPDDLQEILHNSLLMLQLEDQPDDDLSPQLASDMLFARLQYIQTQTQTRARRRRFYRLGFPLSDCQHIEESKVELLKIFLASTEYYNWNETKRCDFLASVMERLLRVHQLQPSTSMPQNIKNHWLLLWQPVLRLWLQGRTPNEMVKSPEIARHTDSPAEISLLVDDLFVYKAPWGFNALSIYLRDIADEIGEHVPDVTEYFSALMKYGVHSPAASNFIAFGVPSRVLALKLAKKCPNEAWDPNQLLAWFIGLDDQQITDLRLEEDETQLLRFAQREARGINRMQVEQTRDQIFKVEIQNGALIQVVQNDDSLVLLDESEDGEARFGLYTLWGEMLGKFRLKDGIPSRWKSPHLIDVSVQQVEGTNLTIQIREL